ncbi:MAG: hypothetical protein JKX84_11665 [Flavobacteriales bacterium]|nr:hypothetical protein [Flavobacteriales bacterium]
MKKEPHLNIKNVSKEELKRNSFNIPEGYFENLTPRIMESVRASENTSEDVAFSWNRILVPAFGMAAVVLAAWFFLNPTSDKTLDLDTVIANMTIEELDLFANFETEELLAYGLVDYTEIELESGMDQEELFDYLLEDDLDLNTIIEEIEI